VSTLWRWLPEDAIRPWRHRSWIFPRRYEQTAVPFDWRFTRADLHDLLRRLDEKSSSPNQHDIHPGTSR
jgi:hypothetical protein